MKLNVTKLLKKGIKKLEKESPIILAGLAIAGIVTVAIEASKAGKIADERLKEAKMKKNRNLDGEEVELTIMEKVTTAGPCYIKAAVIGAATAGCIIGSTSISLKRNVALASICAAAENRAEDIQKKANELLGKGGDEKTIEETAKEKFELAPYEGSEVIITDNGSHLCFDAYSGRYFRSNIEFVRKCVNDLNYQLMGDMYVSLNELYSRLGLENTGAGDAVGWNVDVPIDVVFTSGIAKNGEPCIIMDYRVGPRHDFRGLL